MVGNFEEKGSNVEDKIKIARFMAEKFQVEINSTSVSWLASVR